MDGPLLLYPCPVAGVPLVPLDSVCILGVPLGPPPVCASFVGDGLLGAFASVVSRLVDFEDSQSALFLLRVSFSSVRATHFMRTTPLSHWAGVAASFDAELRSAAELILGFPMSDFTYSQASLSPSLGGLGLRRVVDHADGAFAASRFESARTCGEVWSPVPAPSPSQFAASRSFDSALFDRLLASAPTGASVRGFPA